MADVERFGVFLPSYIWDGDGAERARGIKDFARTVGDQAHLDYLYLLTVADVRGTNPKLWNSWKASLFHDFYERVRRALRQ